MVDCSVFADCGVSPHRALCWLVREAGERRVGSGGSVKGRYKRAYRDAEDALKARGLKFTPLDGERLDMLIAKPNAELRREEVETLTLIANHLLDGFTAAEAAALETRAIERARHQPGARSPTTEMNPAEAALASGWAQIYRGAWREKQALLAELAGEYLIFRWQQRAGAGARPALIVSHMTLTPSPGGDLPGDFRTIGAGSGRDERVVEGKVYEANAAHGVLFSVGRELETCQIRNAMLMPVAKPVHGSILTPHRRDLKGMRLAVGRFSGEPLAYRIWASSVDGPAPGGGDWRGLVKDYIDGESLEVFDRHIPGFAFIREWLGRSVYCVLDDDGDPPTP